MAKNLAVTVTVLFFIFSFSYAQSELDLPEKDVTIKDEVTELPESDAKTAEILLPSQKTGPESQTVEEIEPDIDEIEPDIDRAVETETADRKETTTEAEAVPLTFVTFRPINRHFRQRGFLPFRLGRRCGHFHGRGMVKPWLMRFNGREIPYGKDMIHAGGEKDVDAADHGAVRQMPPKIERFHHGGERFSFGSDLERPLKMMLIPLRRHGDHHHHHHGFHVEEEEEEEKREHEHKHRKHDEEHDEDEHEHRKHDEVDDEDQHHHHHHHHHDHHGGFFWKIRKFVGHF